MKTSFAAVLLTASMLAAPAFAQITIVPMPPAPPPTASGPPMAAPGAPVAPMTAADAQFVQAQLEGNMAEIQAGQLALQRSQDQNVRNFAQKMITDHGAANATLMVIAQRQGIPVPATLDSRHQQMLDMLSTLNGIAFDTRYIDGMILMHDATIQELDNQLVTGQSQILNVWVQNTRPVVLQHEALAHQIRVELPRTG